MAKLLSNTTVSQVSSEVKATWRACRCRWPPASRGRRRRARPRRG
uniref:Uncharacterized protein n=1 Tax=Arundo donax TaxID=35708 RepID=A0A0A9FAL2_ARUDO